MIEEIFNEPLSNGDIVIAPTDKGDIEVIVIEHFLFNKTKILPGRVTLQAEKLLPVDIFGWVVRDLTPVLGVGKRFSLSQKTLRRSTVVKITEQHLRFAQFYPEEIRAKWLELSHKIKAGEKIKRG